MKLLRGFESPSFYRGGFVSIGNFDGVHCGHQAMLTSLVRRARENGVPAVVLTFDPHPIEVLRPDAAPPRLTTIEQRAELLQKCGVDCVIILPTTQRFLTLTADEFFHTIVRTELQARGLVEGPNFFFGKNREGSIAVLRELCLKYQMVLDVIPPVVVDNQLVSSSVIRTLVEAGDVKESARLLDHRYRLSGQVVHGAERGRTLGFPTANLAEITTLIPGEGVYAAQTAIDGIEYGAAVNVGPNPTFGESAKKVEVHILDFDGDLYGKSLDVDFLQKIRDVIRFTSVDGLLGQLQKDLFEIRSIVGKM
ncbi:MAG: bifunctional riboflavin kinase/FAD synthetase [Schlesneria sp.]